MAISSDPFLSDVPTPSRTIGCIPADKNLRNSPDQHFQERTEQSNKRVGEKLQCVYNVSPNARTHAGNG
jgi:hypothetical protein